MQIYNRMNSTVPPPPLIHQYDRQEPVLRLTRAMYPWVPPEMQAPYVRGQYQSGSFRIALGCEAVPP